MTDPYQNSAPDWGGSGPAGQPHESTPPPPQEPTRPSLQATPAMQPPPSQPAGPGGQYPYLQYPPMPAPPKRSAGATALLVFGVIVLMIGGGVAGYFLLGDSGDGPESAADSTGEQSAEEDGGSGTEAPDEEAPDSDFADQTIPIESVGAQMPLPSDRWELQNGPGASLDAMADAAYYGIPLEGNWFATLAVGRYAVPSLPYEADDMTGIAAELAEGWAEEASSVGENPAHTEPEVTETTIDGRPAVIAEAEASWDSSTGTTDTYERVIVALIDVDGVNAILGRAFVPESADGEYETVLAAFGAIDFEE